MASVDLTLLNLQKWNDLHDKIVEYYEKNPNAPHTQCAIDLGIHRNTVKRHMDAGKERVVQ